MEAQYFPKMCLIGCLQKQQLSLKTYILMGCSYNGKIAYEKGHVGAVSFLLKGLVLIT